MRPRIAENRGSDLKAVVVENCVGRFPVHVMDHRSLQREAGHEEILAEEIGDEKVVLAQRLADVVQAAVGVLVDAAEPRHVVLPSIAVAIAEQSNADRLILKEKSAKGGNEGLDADADVVEVEIR